MKAGALEPFLKTMKPGMSLIRAEKPDKVDRPSPPAFIDPTSKTRNQLPKELDIRKASEKPRNDKRKENGTKSASTAASVVHSRSRRANPGVFPSEECSILAKRPPNVPDISLLRESRSLTLDKYSPSEDVSDPRPEQCSNREEPKCANGSKNLASPEGPCAAVRGHRSPLPRGSFSVGSGVLRICSPPNLEHTEDGPPGSTTDSPTRSREGAPIKRGSGLTAEDSIDLSELPLLCPRSEHQASYSVTSHFKGDGPTFALAQTGVNRMPRAKANSPPPTSTPPPAPSQNQGDSSSSVQVSSLGAAAKVVRTVAPRESLVGAWKEVDELEARTRSNVFVGVEVLDMTSSDSF